MDNTNDAKIIGMLGEVNSKVSGMEMILKNIYERMNKNFALLAESQVNSNEKLSEISKDISEINFKIGVLESGIGLNSNKITELSNGKV